MEVKKVRNAQDFSSKMDEWIDLLEKGEMKPQTASTLSGMVSVSLRLNQGQSAYDRRMGVNKPIDFFER